MESEEEEEDSDSLLSLSQTLLHPDNTSAITLSNTQLQTWATTNSGDIVNQFSPVSPADNYSGQAVNANGDNFNRFYNFRSASNNLPTPKNCSFGRTGSSSAQIDNSNTNFQSTNHMNAGDFCHPEDAVNHGNLYFDHTADPRCESYGNKNPENSFRNGAAGSYGHLQRPDTLTKPSTAFSHSECYNNMMSLALVSENDGKLDLFESRSRQHDYTKEMENLYDQSMNKSSRKTLASNEIPSPLDRRQIDASNFENDFNDFEPNPRNFTSSGKGNDPISTSRSNQQLTFHHQQGGFESLPSHKTMTSARVTEGGIQLGNSPLVLDAGTKRAGAVYNVGISSVSQGNECSRSVSLHKKSSFPHQPGELPSDLEPVFQTAHSDFGGHQKLEPHRMFMSTDTGESKGPTELQENDKKDVLAKWSGRPRVHRKMARLLGSEDVKESFQPRDPQKSSSSYPRLVPSLDSAGLFKSSPCPHSGSRDQSGSSRTFLTMEEELDLRTNQHQERNFLRRDENMERSSQRDAGFIQAATFSFDSSVMSSSVPKDSMSNMLNSQAFLAPSQLEIDFNSSLSIPQSHRDIDLNQHFGLQVSKDFDLEPPHNTNSQDDLSFDHTGSQHMSQSELSLSDNLGLGSHSQQELNLEAYFISSSERDLGFGRKFQNQNPRDLNYSSTAADNDFNIEDYMNTTSHRDLGQAYFDRTDLPQDMTMYQKSVPDKSAADVSVMTKDRSRCLEKQSEISELQKELTKTSTKESMKGIRIPRDINRAMEIFQGLQEDEKEEERRKEHHQRQQQQQHQGVSVGSSPKKTFQNKHLVERMNLAERMGLTDQSFLGQSASHFMDDPPVGGLMDQQQLMVGDQQQENQMMMMAQYQQSFTSSDIPTLQKRDVQQGVLDVNYHLLKKLGIHACLKDSSLSQSTSYAGQPSLTGHTANEGHHSNMNHQSNTDQQTNTGHQSSMGHSSNIVSFLTNGLGSESEMRFSDSSILPFPSQQLELVSSPNGVNSLKSTSETSVQCDRNEKVKTSDTSPHSTEEMHSGIDGKQQQEEVLMVSRTNLYTMMKREEFCDAVLSTPKQTVKVHQAVLCSMSQYLSTLLLQMKPSLTGIAASAPLSPTSCYFSQTTSNQGVLLLVNCDNIKPSSMSAFLVFIYLGKAEFSESNVEDLYMLACSLKVSSLKDMCKQYMWATQMSEERIKIPQLLVFSHRSEMRDQSSMADLSSEKVYENKGVNTSPLLNFMEASTQTDRSTTEAGEGGQEEWVMLKKTKQKTVSPSKCRMVKVLSGIESPASSKAGKKGWLSPKRRYKTESQMDGRAMQKEAQCIAKEGENIISVINENISASSPQDNISGLKNVSCVSDKRLIKSLNANPGQTFGDSSVERTSAVMSLMNQDSLTTHSRISRTTVEIAAAAAAAKLSAHSYGTRAAKGLSKTPVSYAILASGQEKKKYGFHQKTATISKKKDFIKSNPPSDFLVHLDPNPPSDYVVHQKIHHNLHLDSNPPSDFVLHHNVHLDFHVPGLNHDTALDPSHGAHVKGGLNEDKSTEEARTDDYRTSVKRPFKKSIVHRTRSEEVFRNMLILENMEMKDGTLDMGTSHHQNSGLVDYMDTSVSHVSTLIDSIVNTMESETGDMDFQKVISDLDTELSKSPLLTTASTTSSVSSTSLTSPLKSPQRTASESPLKSKPTPQGFRKRLIHLMNSENSLASPAASLPCQQVVDPSTSQETFRETHSIINVSYTSTLVQKDSSPASLQTISAVTSLTSSAENSVSSLCLSSSPEKSGSSLSLSTSPEKLGPAISLASNPDGPCLVISAMDTSPGNCVTMLGSLNGQLTGSEGKSGNFETPRSSNVTDKGLSPSMGTFSSMTDHDLGLKDEDGQQFHHKIFKRKKKPKARKLPAVEPEGAYIKMKLKKFLSNDSEVGVVKVRQRKPTGSDTEGGVKKQKRPSSSTDGPDPPAKVRPPPKKRAKMELELLKAASKAIPEEKVCDATIKEENPLVTLLVESDWTKNLVREKSDPVQCDDNSAPNDAGDNQVGIEEVKVTESKKKVKPVSKTSLLSSFKEADASIKSSQADPAEEPELVTILENMMRPRGLRFQQYNCTLCQTKFKSARRIVKHLHQHGLSGEESLSKVVICEKDKEPEACNVCGYITKDQSYHYMHYHKYFKHGIPLPMGWRPDQCEMCGKECFTKFQLKEHMQTHTDKPTFICWKCGQSFKTRNGCNSHFFHKHSEVRKHVCKACGKSFKTWTQLKVHVRSHTGERPFACVECGHRSTTQGNMKLHLNTHGYSKETIQELMDTINKNVPEMTPESLDEIMLSVAVKVQEDGKETKKIRKKKSGKKNDVKENEVSIKEENKELLDKIKVEEKKKTKKEKRSKKTLRFEGSEIRRLFSAPLSKLKPPKLKVTRQIQPAKAMGNTSAVTHNEEAGVIQACQGNNEVDLNRFLDINSLNVLLHQQNQDSTTFLIPLSQSDQQPSVSSIQYSHPQHHTLEPSALLGYMVIRTGEHNSQDATLIRTSVGQPGENNAMGGSNGSMTLPMFSQADIMMQALSQPVQLIQSHLPARLQLCGQDMVIQKNHCLGGPKHMETLELQDMSLNSMGSNVTVMTDGQQHNEGSFQAVIEETVMVQQNGVATDQNPADIYRYLDVAGGGQSVLVPVTSGSFVKFPVSRTDGVTQQCYTVMTTEGCQVVTASGPLAVAMESGDTTHLASQKYEAQGHSDLADGSMEI